MKGWTLAALAAQFIVIVWGIYCSLAPEGWHFRIQPELAIVCAVFSLTLFPLSIGLLSKQSQESGDRELLRLVAEFHGSAGAHHESIFYSVWQHQVGLAKHNVDITHLGLTSPLDSFGTESSNYFKKIKTQIKKSNARFRRIERISSKKLNWIVKLCEDLGGLSNFSLSIYEDPKIEDDDINTCTMSVCRIDSSFAWLIAVAEEASTESSRDIMITGADNIKVLSGYFEKRLWRRSHALITNGQIDSTYLEELKNRYGQQ